MAAQRRSGLCARVASPVWPASAAGSRLCPLGHAPCPVLTFDAPDQALARARVFGRAMGRKNQFSDINPELVMTATPHGGDVWPQFSVVLQPQDEGTAGKSLMTRRLKCLHRS